MRKLLLLPPPPIGRDSVHPCQEPDYHRHCCLQCRCHVWPRHVTSVIPAAPRSPWCVSAVEEAGA